MLLQVRPHMRDFGLLAHGVRGSKSRGSLCYLVEDSWPMWVDSHDGVVVVEIRLDLVEGVRYRSAASQFFKSEWFIFCPLSRTWSLDLIPLIFNDIPSANRLVNQSKINNNMVSIIYQCLHLPGMGVEAKWGARPPCCHQVVVNLVTFVIFHLLVIP